MERSGKNDLFFQDCGELALLSKVYDLCGDLCGDGTASLHLLSAYMGIYPSAPLALHSFVCYPDP